MKDILLENKLKEYKKGDIIGLNSDVIFKAVFVRNKDVLLKMIKDLFSIDDSINPITIVGYETVPSNKSGKTYRSDLLVILSDKSYVLIEMNNSNGIESIDRNLVQLVRIHGQVLKGGTDDMELRKYRLRGINFNNFRNETGKAIDTFAFCNIGTGKIVSFIYSFCNVDIEKCKELVYDIDVQNLSKSVRWGAIMKEENIEELSNILGEDMLSMEEKEEFLNTIKEVNDDERILNDWVLEKLAETKVKDQINYATSEGIRQGIEKGIEQGIEQGREEGMEDTKIELIKNMLLNKLNYEVISNISGKTIEEIKEIENSIKE